MNKKRHKLTDWFEKQLATNEPFDGGEVEQDPKLKKAFEKAVKRINYKNEQREEASLRRNNEETEA